MVYLKKEHSKISDKMRTFSKFKLRHFSHMVKSEICKEKTPYVYQKKNL